MLLFPATNYEKPSEQLLHWVDFHFHFHSVLMNHLNKPVDASCTFFVARFTVA